MIAIIQKILPNSEAKLRILRAVYKNPGINYSGLVRQSRTSPNIVLDYVNRLVEAGILSEKRLGGKSKTHIRLLSPNLSEMGMDIFSLVEAEERDIFLKKYRELKPIAGQLAELLSFPPPASKVKFCLVYGSFARLSAGRESDLDLWAVGKADAATRKRIGEIFSTLGREYTMTIEEESEFLKKASSPPDPLHQNIIKEHIIIWGEREFLKLMSLVRGT